MSDQVACKEVATVELFTPTFLHDGRPLIVKDKVLDLAILAYNHLDDTMLLADVENMTKIT